MSVPAPMTLPSLVVACSAFQPTHWSASMTPARSAKASALVSTSLLHPADLDALDVGQPAARVELLEELRVVDLLVGGDVLLDRDVRVQFVVLGEEPGLLVAELPEVGDGQRDVPVRVGAGAARRVRVAAAAGQQQGRDRQARGGQDRGSAAPAGDGAGDAHSTTPCSGVGRSGVTFRASCSGAGRSGCVPGVFRVKGRHARCRSGGSAVRRGSAPTRRCRKVPASEGWVSRVEGASVARACPASHGTVSCRGLATTRIRRPGFHAVREMRRSGAWRAGRTARRSRRTPQPCPPPQRFPSSVVHTGPPSGR